MRWIETLIEKFGTKLIGAWVTKAVTALAAVLVTRGFMSGDKSGDWIAANAEWLTGVVVGLLSVWLTKKRQAAHTDEKTTALYSAPPGYVLVPEGSQTEPAPANPETKPVTILPGAGPGADLIKGR